ncbi:MAG TPA: ice-binding family protein [Pseudolysinimonas sp.]|nr:ice-binding family protein [Pseudolysinimonas sp.]
MSALVTRRIGAVHIVGTAGLAAALLLIPTGAQAAVIPSIVLGTASTFSALGGSAVTNTGPSILNADLGVSPGSSLTGWAPPGTVLGSTHATDAVAAQAQLDVTTAANLLMGLPSYNVGSSDLNGLTFVAGAYSSASSLLNTGTITLQGDADDVFIFTAVSDLTTGSTSNIAFIGAVQACNVYWRVGSSATLGTNSAFVGTLIAQASVAATTGATIDGRLFAQTGAVTLDDNVFTGPTCDLSTGDGSTGGTTGGTTSAGSAPTGGTGGSGGSGGSGGTGAVGGVTTSAGALAATGSTLSWPTITGAALAIGFGSLLTVIGQRGSGAHRLRRRGALG